jgi:hypothetical protein
MTRIPRFTALSPPASLGDLRSGIAFAQGIAEGAEKGGFFFIAVERGFDKRTGGTLRSRTAMKTGSACGKTASKIILARMSRITRLKAMGCLKKSGRRFLKNIRPPWTFLSEGGASEARNVGQLNPYFFF